MLTIPMDALMAAARALLAADAAVIEAQAALDTATQRARQLREETLPGAMLELGLSSLHLESGESLTLKQEVYAKIASADQAQAFAWLMRHDFEGIIKTDVGVSFGKGETKEALRLYKSLVKQKLPVEYAQSVHASTLKAFVRERMALGTAFPMDLFGAWPVFAVKLSMKK